MSVSQSRRPNHASEATACRTQLELLVTRLSHGDMNGWTVGSCPPVRVSSWVKACQR